MSADLHNLEALTEELKRLKRRSAASMLLAGANFAVAWPKCVHLVQGGSNRLPEPCHEGHRPRA